MYVCICMSNCNSAFSRLLLRGAPEYMSPSPSVCLAVCLYLSHSFYVRLCLWAVGERRFDAASKYKCKKHLLTLYFGLAYAIDLCEIHACHILRIH